MLAHLGASQAWGVQGDRGVCAAAAAGRRKESARSRRDLRRLKRREKESWLRWPCAVCCTHLRKRLYLWYTILDSVAQRLAAEDEVSMHEVARKAVGQEKRKKCSEICFLARRNNPGVRYTPALYPPKESNTNCDLRILNPSVLNLSKDIHIFAQTRQWRHPRHGHNLCCSNPVVKSSGSWQISGSPQMSQY